jgi:hypothetical protein
MDMVFKSSANHEPVDRQVPDSGESTAEDEKEEGR